MYICVYLYIWQACVAEWISQGYRSFSRLTDARARVRPTAAAYVRKSLLAEVFIVTTQPKKVLKTTIIRKTNRSLIDARARVRPTAAAYVRMSLLAEVFIVAIQSLKVLKKRR